MAVSDKELERRYTPSVSECRASGIKANSYCIDRAAAELQARRALLGGIVDFVVFVVSDGSGSHAYARDIHNHLKHPPDTMWDHVRFLHFDERDVFDVRNPHLLSKEKQGRTFFGVGFKNEWLEAYENKLLSVEAPPELRAAGPGLQASGWNNSDSPNTVTIERQVGGSRESRKMTSSGWEIGQHITSKTSVKGSTGIIPGGEVSQEIEIGIEGGYSHGKESEITESDEWSYTFNVQKEVAAHRQARLQFSWDEQTYIERYVEAGTFDWSTISIDIPKPFLNGAWREFAEGKITMHWHGYYSHASWKSGRRLVFDGLQHIIDICRGSEPHLFNKKDNRLADWLDDVRHRTTALGSIVVREEGIDFRYRDM